MVDICGTSVVQFVVSHDLQLWLLLPVRGPRVVLLHPEDEKREHRAFPDDNPVTGTSRERRV